MKHSGILGLLTALATLSSCATAKYVSVEDDMNNEWVGRRHSEIVREFGAPDRETSDGKNGTIKVTYQHRTHFISVEDVDRFQDGVEQVLRIAVENPQITIGDLLDKLQVKE